MNKEEELADEYQSNHEQLYHVDSYPIAVVKELERNAYICGMKQAEKDLALTVEDIERIDIFLCAIRSNKSGAFTFRKLSDEQYQAVLCRINQISKSNE